MFNLAEINLDIAGSTLLLVFAFLVAVGLSLFVYRKTIPPVSRGWRILLISLRSAVIILILLLLFEPILSITRKKEEKPVVAVLVDNSASMSLVDEQVDRQQELRNILAAEIFRNQPDDYELRFYPFSYKLFEETEVSPDSLTLDDDGTDIRQALEELKQKLAEKYFASVILITDGADNLGENPARYVSDYGIPIYPIAVGDPAQQKDVLITNYVTNEVAYAGTRIPVDVYIKSSGFEGQRISLSLSHKGQALDSKMVTLSGNGLEQKVRLNFVPEQDGLFKYELKLPELEGELTRINNSKSFYVRVLKSKLKILIVAGGPGADFVFLKRALAADQNFDLQSYVEKSKGRFYQGASLPTQEQLSKFDCLILVDFPRQTSSQAALNNLKAVLSKGTPVLYFPGKATDFEKLRTLTDFTPLAAKPVTGPEQIVYLRPLPPGMHHPLLRLSEDDLENREKWQELPPVFSSLRSVRLKDNAQILAGIDIDRSPGVSVRNLPLIAVHATGNRKSAAFFAYGLWRWDLLMWSIGKTNNSYLTFLRNTIRWLTTEEDSKLVKISSNKEIYRSGEEVKFTAQVYFEDYQPVDGADVTVQLTGGKETQQLTLENIGDGRYEGSFQVLEGGDYQYTGTAHQQGRVLGRDSGKFSVEEFSLEYQNTRMNEDLLKRMALTSGGEFYTSADFGDLKNKLRFPEKYVTLRNEWEIWHRVPYLILCILLLGSEWFIRKRKGML